VLFDGFQRRDAPDRVGERGVLLGAALEVALRLPQRDEDEARGLQVGGVEEGALGGGVAQRRAQVEDVRQRHRRVEALGLGVLLDAREFGAQPLGGVGGPHLAQAVLAEVAAQALPQLRADHVEAQLFLQRGRVGGHWRRSNFD